MRIIPAIDLIEGKCVRLTQGDYASQKVYNENPLEVAKAFEDNGIKFIHLVDLDGAKSKRIINYKVLERIASKTNLMIDFGGGLRTTEDVDIAFNSGASKITGGSIAVEDPSLFLSWLKSFGAQRIMLGADCRNGKIATNGWLEESTQKVLNFIQEYEQKGIEEVICTDINKDGMLEGPSLDLYAEVLTKTKVKLVASGGVSSLQDLEKLKAINCNAAIVGKAIYEGKIQLKELKDFI